MRPARYLIPFCAASTLFVVMILLLVRHGLHQNAGIFVYPLDDAYIHLAISRNLALHGVWGITPYDFSGASSSPGWTLLLAALIRLVGVHLLTPLVLNVIAALLLLLVASIVLDRMLPQATITFLTVALLALVLVTPLPGLAIIGMEHVLHSLAVLCLVATAAWIVRRPVEAPVRWAEGSALIISSVACGALRYESCFVIVITAAVLLLHRRIGLAIWMGVAAALGPIVYGVYSYAHSQIVLPFSVVMKSSVRIPSPY